MVTKETALGDMEEPVTLYQGFLLTYLSQAWMIWFVLVACIVKIKQHRFADTHWRNVPFKS